MKDTSFIKWRNGFAEKRPSVAKRIAPSEQDTKKTHHVRAWRTLPALCIVFCTLLVALSATGGPLFANTISIDSAVFRYVGKVILNGGMPYRDTFDHKGPLLYLIQVAGLSLGTQGIWALEVLTLLLAFLYLYKTVRLTGAGRKLSCLSVFFGALFLGDVFQGGNFTEEYALPFLSVSFYIFLRYLKESKTTWRRMMICGASCAAVTLLRINMVGLWVVMCSGITLNLARKKRIAEIFCNAFWFLAGFLTLSAPVLLWLYANRAFPMFVEDYFLFNFQYTSGMTERASLKAKIQALYYTLKDCNSLFAFSALCYAWASKFKFRDLLCLLSFGFNLFLMCLSGQTYSHYRMILLPLFVYAVSVLLMEFEVALAPRKKLTAIGVLSLILAIPFSSALSPLFFHADNSSLKIARIVQESSDTTDLITVCGNQDSIYLFANRRSVSKYSYQSVCFLTGSVKSAEMREEYFQDVETLKPKIIVLPLDYPGYDRMKEIADANYQLLDTVNNMEIYSLTSRETFKEGGTS